MKSLIAELRGKRLGLVPAVLSITMAFVPGWASAKDLTEADPHVSETQGDLVSDGGVKEAVEYDTTFSEPVASGSNFRIETIDFEPPDKTGWEFRTLKDSSEYADVIPSTFDASAPSIETQGKDFIRVRWIVTEVTPSADNWNLFVEGNLKPPTSQSLGGTGSVPTYYWAANVRAVDARVQLAFTFDDGPHLAIATGKTTAIVKTLKEKAKKYKKEVLATFFVEMERIKTATGKKILKEHIDANDHEVAIHGADPNTHHRRHQHTPDLKTKINNMKTVIASAAAGGQTAVSVRPPGGWGGWTQGNVYDKPQLTQIYSDTSLRRYTGEGTGGTNSWGTDYPSNGNTAPSAQQRADFIKDITDVIDAAVAAAQADPNKKATKKLVILMHDLRTPDKDDIGNIIDEVEAYAAKHHAVIEYVRMKDLP